jgi:hypothetical protein
MKSVIHDWNDAQSRRLLENCRRAMGEDAKVLVIERVVPERLELSPEHQALAVVDLHMLVALSAQERTESEFRTLLHSAGLDVTRVVPADVEYSILEAVATYHGGRAPL